MRVLALILSLGVLSLGFANPQKIAVYKIDSKVLPKEDCAELARYITTEISKDPAYQVLSWAEVGRMLGFISDRQNVSGSVAKSDSAVKCSDDKCFSKIGDRLGVELMVAGGVSKIGNRYLVNLTLTNIEEAKTVKTVSAQVKGDLGDILDSLPPMIGSLLGKTVVVDPALAAARARQLADSLAQIEKDRLALIEKRKQDSIIDYERSRELAQQAEREREATIEKQKQDSLFAVQKAQEAERDRLAAIEKQKQDSVAAQKERDGKQAELDEQQRKQEQADQLSASVARGGESSTLRSASRWGGLGLGVVGVALVVKFNADGASAKGRYDNTQDAAAMATEWDAIQSAKTGMTVSSILGAVGFAAFGLSFAF